ncbi:MAG: T9SS type A sorting domain-containing protein [Chitinophagaceae bacterium]|nr:T9SS type A sorting domain-containing protein [Chitinophagaceae bacterium]
MKQSLVFLINLFFLHIAGAQSSLHQLPDVKNAIGRNPVKIDDVIRVNREMKTNPQKSRAADLKVSVNTLKTIEEGEAFIAMNPTDSNKLVLCYAERSAAGLSFPVFTTDNGGQTWTQSAFDALTYLQDDFPGGVLRGGGNPVFAYDKDGKLYFSWTYMASNITSLDTIHACMYLAHSIDDGISWNIATGPDRFIGRSVIDSTTYIAFANSEGYYERPWLAVDQSNGINENSLYSSFVYHPNISEASGLNGIFVKKKVISSTGFNAAKKQVFSGAAQFGNVAVDSNGKLHVTFIDIDSQRVLHAVSTDGGNNFSTPHVIGIGTNLMGAQGNGFIHNYENSAVNLCIDGSNNLHVVWSDFPVNPNVNYDSYYSRSTDGGTNWSPPILLSSKFLPGIKVLMPTICAYKNKISIGGYAIDFNKVSDYYMITSNNQGTSWLPSRKVSTQSTYFADTSNLGKRFGEYFSAVRNQTNVYQIWSDGRDTSGPKMYVSVTHEWSTGVSEVTPVNSSFILEKYYPVPTTDQLNLTFKSTEPNNLKLSITTMDGSIVQQQSSKISMGTSTIQIPIHSVAAGNYILNIESEDGFVFTRMIHKD